MKVKMRQRPLADFGMADCGCCSRLSWKVHKLDKQILKEALDSIDEPMFIWYEHEEEWI